MSSAIMRRSSSKKGLQNLMKVTAQRSIEDAEEVERERRRRARESFRRTSSNQGESPQDSPAENSLYDGNLKPADSPSLEEDEGFSDWTQRRERRRQERMQELTQGPQEVDDEANGAVMNTTHDADTERLFLASDTPSTRLQRQQHELKDAGPLRRKSERGAEQSREVLGAVGTRREKEREEVHRPETGVEERKEMKVSYTSKVLLQQDVKYSNTNGDAVGVNVPPCIKTKKPVSLGSRPVGHTVEPEEVAAMLETEQRLEKMRRSHQAKESQELEQLRHRQAEAEQELEELRRRKEERRRVREEEERRREEEEHQRLAKEEVTNDGMFLAQEEKKQMKVDIERRRFEAAERMKNLSTSSVEDELFSPLSPKASTQKKANEEGLTAESTCTITERTESLNRSLKKSSSFKKTQLPILLTKIDDKLEQYTHAIENSHEARTTKQSLVDIPNSPEAVALKKNLFEAGELGGQSLTKGTLCKDTEGLKVGVSGLITQWVKGNPESPGTQSPSRPTDVKPVDVMQKKNMWEIIANNGSPEQRPRGASLKRYKFVVTGHGKYEKIPVDTDTGDGHSNGKSELCQGDY